MCGICGFAGSGDNDIIRRMTAELVHRGPDAEGIWSEPATGVFLGHRRLSVLDITGGSQPMWTADGCTGITYNGEIYNYRELRSELEKRGHTFFTDHSDTEVLLHGYEEWGGGIAERCNGMWAFALYDRRKKLLFLSRDRFGKKPLYYTEAGSTFIFSSLLASLIKHPLCNRTVDALSLKKYFAYNFIPAPRSIYASVFKLPAGHNGWYSLTDNVLRIEKYWEFLIEPYETTGKGSEEEWCEELRTLLQQAVERRLVADVPVGLFLSGGMDSTAVTCFAAKKRGGAACRTFSIGFDEPSFDETIYARYAAKLLGTTHHHREFSFATARSLLDDVIEKIDEPFGDSSILPTYLLCKEARQQVTVALGGDGADELFAGYDPFRAVAIAELYNKMVPKPLHHAISAIAARLPVSHGNMSPDFKLKRTLKGLGYPPSLWNPVWLGSVDIKEIEALFAEPCDVESLYSEAIACWDGCLQKNVVDRTLQFYTRLYLQDDICAKIDRAGMAHSLEVRSPFLDSDLVNFVRKIPGAYKLRRGETKYLLKKALAPILPASILHRRKKGFGVPVGRWFKDGDLTIDTAFPIPGMKSGCIQKYLTDHITGKNDNRLFLWNVWLVHRFLRKNG